MTKRARPCASLCSRGRAGVIALVASGALFAASTAATEVELRPSRGHDIAVRPADATPLVLQRIETPAVHVPHVFTRGTFPRFTGAGIDLNRVNDAIKQSVLANQRDFASQVPKEEAQLHRRRASYGIYETQIDGRLTSASTVVVSALMPTLELLPAGVDGEWWLAVTVRVSDGRRLAIGDLFSGQRGLRVLAASAKRLLTGANACVRASLADPVTGREFENGFRPEPRHYRFFALTPNGLAIGFPVGQVAGPPCGRIDVSVAYETLRPYLNQSAARLIAGVRRPRMPK